MKFHINSIRIKILLLMGVIFIGFLLFELLAVYPRLIQSREEGAHKELQGIALGLAQGVDSVFRSTRTEVESASMLPDILSGDTARQRKTLENLNQITQYLNYYYLADDQGRYLIHPLNPELEGTPVSPKERECHLRAKETGSPAQLETMRTEQGQLLSGFATPLFDETGEISGYLCGMVVMNIKKSSAIIINQARIGKRGHVYMTSEKGWLIAHREDTPDFSDFRIRDYSIHDPVTRGLQGEEGLTHYPYRGEVWTAYTAPVAASGWVVVAQQPSRDIWITAVTTTADTILIFTAAFVVCGIMIFLLVGRSLRPLRKLITAVAAGQPVNELSISGDEIGRLAALFATLYGELKEAKDRAEENDRLKTAFLANISHEIRTPMNGILGFTELLRDTHLREHERERFLEIIRESGLRMLNIINDLIDISRIESGTVPIHLKECDIGLLLSHLHATFFPEADRKNLDLLLSGSPRPNDVWIHTDETKLNQILTNLIRNGIKFTDTGRVEIRYNRLPDLHEFRITDTGPGIPPEDQEMIFERFRQGEHTATCTSEGAGLGLAISRSYAEMIGGTLTVESEPGQGAAFILHLPAK